MILVLPTRNKDCQVHLTAGAQVPLVISAFQSLSHPRVPFSLRGQSYKQFGVPYLH